jgi:Mitochondrial ribosomal protein (VAR1)
VNNISPLLTKTEYLLKSVFRSMFSLISRPIYLIKHDKIIIRLFVYLSPKLDKYLDTSTTTSLPQGLACTEKSEAIPTFGSEQYAAKRENSSSKSLNTLALLSGKKIYSKQGTVAGFSSNVSGFKIRKFLRFKSFRPNAIEILKSQIQISNTLAPTPQPLKQKSGEEQAPSLRALMRRDKTNAYPSPITRFSEGGGENNRVAGAKLATPFTLSDGGAGHNNITPRYPYTSLVSNFKYSLDKLCLIFENIFKKKVEFEIIKAQLPFQDSNVLAQILGYNANKYKFRQMLKILIPRAVIKNPSRPLTLLKGKDLFLRSRIGSAEDLKQPVTASLPLPSRFSHPSLGGEGYGSLSYLSGMNIKLAGRLMTQSMRPRFTVQSIQEGSLARVKVHFVEKSRFTGKNKRGAFSFTVSISHVFN